MKKIVILSWWTGDEREIALKSAWYFKDNIWQDYDYYELPEQLENFISNKHKYNLAIPIFHWEYGEDGRIFAFLDILWIPQALSPYSTHSLCLDKYKSNLLAEKLWLKVPKQFLIQRCSHGWYCKWKKTKGEKEIGFPMIMKPNKGGSSYHTYKANNHEEYDKYFDIIEKQSHDDLLLQKFLVAEEYSIPVVAWETLPIMKLEKESLDMFFDYESKYESEAVIKEVFPEIEAWLRQQLEEQSLSIYKLFWIKWFCRIDFLVDKNNTAWFLEANTIPGMSPASIVPKSWKKTWWKPSELVNNIISDR